MAAIGVALVVAVGGTVIGGQFCTGPDRDGCEDRYTVDGDRTAPFFDADWYGWPVKWKTDMSEERFLHQEASRLLLDKRGISATLLVASLSMWFAAAIIPQGVALGVYWSWRRRRRLGLGSQRRGGSR